MYWLATIRLQDKIKKVDKGTNFGIQPRNAEQSFAFEVLNDPNIKLVGLTGKAVPERRCWRWPLP